MKSNFFLSIHQSSVPTPNKVSAEVLLRAANRRLHEEILQGLETLEEELHEAEVAAENEALHHRAFRGEMLDN